MKHPYHVITAFNRWQNLQAMIDLLGPLNLTWEPIFDDTPENRDRFPKQDWIVPRFCPLAPEGWHPAAWPIYWHPCHCEIDPRARYCILTDDDGYEADFFDKIDSVDGDVLIASMKRGDHSAASGYPTDTLLAAPENMHCARIGGEQIVVSGVIWSKFRHLHTAAGDWPWIAAITSAYAPVFVPDAFVRFNALEPGRWKSSFAK